jgi:hypothetical protein
LWRPIRAVVPELIISNTIIVSICMSIKYGQSLRLTDNKVTSFKLQSFSFEVLWRAHPCYRRLSYSDPSHQKDDGSHWVKVFKTIWLWRWHKSVNCLWSLIFFSYSLSLLFFSFIFPSLFNALTCKIVSSGSKCSRKTYSQSLHPVCDAVLARQLLRHISIPGSLYRGWNFRATWKLLHLQNRLTNPNNALGIYIYKHQAGVNHSTLWISNEHIPVYQWGFINDECALYFGQVDGFPTFNIHCRNWMMMTEIVWLSAYSTFGVW